MQITNTSINKIRFTMEYREKNSHLKIEPAEFVSNGYIMTRIV